MTFFKDLGAPFPLFEGAVESALEYRGDEGDTGIYVFRCVPCARFTAHWDIE